MDWQALADAVIARRVELGFRTRESFAAETGLSSRLLGDLERSQRDNYDRTTIARLEHALQWPRGRVLEILREPPDHDDGGPFSLHPDAVTARVTRLLAADTPLGKDIRWSLASAIAGMLDLVDRPTAAGRGLRDQEAEKMFLATIAAHNQALRREPALREKPAGRHVAHDHTSGTSA